MSTGAYWLPRMTSPFSSWSSLFSSWLFPRRRGPTKRSPAGQYNSWCASSTRGRPIRLPPDVICMTQESEILGPLPERRILALLLTLRCTAECAECGTQSSPRVRTRLPEDEAARLIDEAAADDYDAVAFTGGEPMLY